MIILILLLLGGTASADIGDQAKLVGVGSTYQQVQAAWSDECGLYATSQTITGTLQVLDCVVYIANDIDYQAHWMYYLNNGRVTEINNFTVGI